MDTTTITTTDTTTGEATTPHGHRWQEAGQAWGNRAGDWACLFEHYAIDVIAAIFPGIGVSAGTSLLDVACGSGLAIRMAEGMGAVVAGLDAAAPLVAIARDRTPTADVRVGTMFELPWDDGSFDAVSSINGIWGGCEGALAEAHRVLRPGGRIGISYWGDGHLDLRPCFRAFAAASPPEHRDGMRRTNDMARPGVAEAMLTSVGFDVVERGARTPTFERPDEETAWRAVSSLGPAVPALAAVGPAALRPAVLAALEPIRDRNGIYRFRNDHRYVVAAKPG